MVLRQISDTNTDGTVLGSKSGDLISFYGITPVSQRSSSLQTSSNISATSASFGASQANWAVEVTNTLVGLGLWKGS